MKTNYFGDNVIIDLFNFGQRDCLLGATYGVMENGKE